jgi:hypothetical protein
VAALNKQQLEARERQAQQPVTWMVHLDPHAAHPWPCCDGVRNGIRPCSDDVSGEAGRRLECCSRP